MTRDSGHGGRKRALSIIVAITASIGPLFLLRDRPEIWVPYVEHGTFMEGQSLVRHVESFRRRQGRVPEPAEVHLLDWPRVTYTRVNQHRYAVSFSFVLGESFTYDSADQKWVARELVP